MTDLGIASKEIYFLGFKIERRDPDGPEESYEESIKETVVFDAREFVKENIVAKA